MADDSTPIARWRARMGLSQRAAAEALGMSLSAYQEQERGASFAGAPREASRVLLLACAALEAGLSPIGASE
ncbi:helix-turn-helix domain-containing protein [Coralloluteibacterium thermophilus]|uniref:Helix-turn-helix domain-containing protein n=1 Tax=Coralloluteibacterium thermophilum TaxID=2707049 RepID=A0ABV9NQE5_9GAMM